MASVKIDPVIGDKFSTQPYLLVYHLENGSCLIESFFSLQMAMDVIEGCKSGMSGVTKVTLYSKLEV
jgi:hypothetical protein